LAPFMPELGKVVSPFVGGASVEIAMGCSGLEVSAYDVCDPLCDFWECVCNWPDDLAKLVSRHHVTFDRISRKGSSEESRKWFKRMRDRMSSNALIKLERAAAVFVINRTSRSGNIYNGGMNNPSSRSPENNRFTRSSIDRLRKFKCDGLTVKSADFRDSLRENPDAFAFLDPPYPDVEAIYSGHDGFLWAEFAKEVRKRENWVCCLNDVPVVREMFSGFRAIPYDLNWSMASSGGALKKSNEILIVSHDAVIPESYQSIAM